MGRTGRKLFFPAGIAFFVLLSLAGSNALADQTLNISVIVTSSIVESHTDVDFGTIELDPAGDTLTVDASSGSATPALPGGSASVISGGGSGTITVSANIAFTITAVYENTVTLTSGSDTLNVTDMDLYSEGGSANGSVSHSAGTPPANDTVINVGGQIVFPANTPTGTYTGTTTVVLNYT